MQKEGKTKKSRNLNSKEVKLEKKYQALEEKNKQLRVEITGAKTTIKELKALNKKCKESKSRFEAVFSQSMLGNKIIDPDLKILEVNGALLQMLGYAEKELIGHKIIEFSHPDFIPHWQKLQKSLWKENIPAFKIEIILRKKDGSDLWCQATSTLFQDQGASLGYTSLEDISDRIALEKKLKEQYDNQETIMHMVAHDLKSPLHNINLAAGFLNENLGKLSPREKAEQEASFTFTHLIKDTTGQALNIIDDLLIIGDVDANNFVQEEINLRPFIQAFLDTASLKAQEKNIRIEIHAPKKPVYALLDPEKFRRVLENILSNAVKFSKPDGLVTITLKKKGEKALIFIQDNGIGIPDKLLPSIFNKFTKARRKGTQGEATTGLGLFIVKQIIEKQGGKISVESEENVKTTFSIELKGIED